MVSSTPRTLTARYREPALMALIMVVCVLAIWLRNHDILRDTFDYSTVIVAAGKVEAGLKPYVDVRSPMQSSVYLFNYLTEQIFGRDYLSLSLGGLVQALGGALLIASLLRRPLGGVAATLVAVAVAMAGLLQHMVFFYNPLGILCLGVVLLGLAIEPDLWPVRTWRTVAIYGALFVGGINKLNFQGATLVLSGLLGLAAWTDRRITGAAWVRNIALLMLMGIGLPLAFELLWTGATLQQWFANVVLLPDARHHVVTRILDPAIYLEPAYDFHHHLLVDPMGGIGLAVLTFTGGWLLWEARAKRRSVGAWLTRLALLAAGGLVGALLMVTNHEAVVLTSLSYPLLSLAIYLQHRGSGSSADRWTGRTLLAAMSIWGVVGGYAAWNGSRVLYAPNAPRRWAYVPLNSESRALSYLKGVRMHPEQIDALERVSARVAALEDGDGKLTSVLFGPALEWMERAYPEAIVRGAPIWYHAGTTLHDVDEQYFRDLLGGGRRHLITHKFWQSWPHSIERLLADEYRTEVVGGRDVLYLPRDPSLPVANRSEDRSLPVDVFRSETGSNILLSATRFSGGMAIQPGPSGPMFGARGASSWSWPLGANSLQGRAVASLAPEAIAGGSVTFRILSDDPETGAVLWTSTVTLDPQCREVVVPFTQHPAGRPLWFLAAVQARDAPGAIVAGWRDIRITHATLPGRSAPLPFGRDLQKVTRWSGGEGSNSIWYARSPDSAEDGGWIEVPAQNWRRSETPLSRVSVGLELRPNPANPADPVVVTLAWYRAGRFEIMSEQMIDLRVIQSLTLTAPVTEPDGWVAILTRPAGGEGAGHLMRIRSWESQ